ncbi:hypothetical protein SERLA73DRAFT_135638, partial [Serpula lacrymans var. lacrymans S7.3]
MSSGWGSPALYIPGTLHNHFHSQWLKTLFSPNTETSFAKWDRVSYDSELQSEPGKLLVTLLM